jgi:hypothetical protein
MKLEAIIRGLLSSNSKEEECKEERKKQGESLLGAEEDDEVEREYDRSSWRFEEIMEEYKNREEKLKEERLQKQRKGKQDVPGSYEIQEGC